MSPLSYIILAIVLLCMAYAVYKTVKNRRKIFTCGGDCEHCMQNCKHRK